MLQGGWQGLRAVLPALWVCDRCSPLSQRSTWLLHSFFLPGLDCCGSVSLLLMDRVWHLCSSSVVGVWSVESFKMGRDQLSHTGQRETFIYMQFCNMLLKFTILRSIFFLLLKAFWSISPTLSSKTPHKIFSSPFIPFHAFKKYMYTPYMSSKCTDLEDAIFSVLDFLNCCLQ